MQKILFIEDEPDHIAIYQTKLEDEGFSFASATNAKTALSFIEQDKPDLILLDLLLVDENGLEILAKLKNDEATKDIPVIVFTNYDEKEYRSEAIRLGAIDFIPKTGVTPDEMVGKIRKILGVKINK